MGPGRYRYIGAYHYVLMRTPRLQDVAVRARTAVPFSRRTLYVKFRGQLGPLCQILALLRCCQKTEEPRAPTIPSGQLSRDRGAAHTGDRDTDMA